MVGPLGVRVGDRVRLLYMGPDPDPIAPGAEGTVDWLSDLTNFGAAGGGWQVGVRWDSGRRLLLAWPEDRFEVLRSAGAR
jgi:hypothetical protein